MKTIPQWNTLLCCSIFRNNFSIGDIFACLFEEFLLSTDVFTRFQMFYIAAKTCACFRTFLHEFLLLWNVSICLRTFYIGPAHFLHFLHELCIFAYILHTVVHDCIQLFIVPLPCACHLICFCTLTVGLYLLHINHYSSLILMLCTNITMYMGGP